MSKFDETIQQKQINLQVGRIIQLDAKILDDALISAFRVALRDGLRDGEICLPFSNCLSDFLGTHKDSLLKLFYHLMHAFTGQSPGQRLMNIRYGNFTKLKGLLNYTFCILLPTISNSLFRPLPSYLRHKRLFIRRIIVAFKIFDFCYFLYFLKFGGPSHPIEALLRLKPVYDKTPRIGQINYGALNRELFGHSFAYILILLIPLWTRLFNFLKTAIFKEEDIKSNSDVNDRLVCTKCLKTPICAIRARKNNLASQWRIYCFFCFTSIQGIERKDWEVEQLTSDNM
ncbi:unnamed protein product [Meloidogyne enterolobii]|uniref:Uncharacterized protein n=1 Tax=Meloidogyne enterolobii TaxID=390850 RepID=A0ACB1A8U8_MELEN